MDANLNICPPLAKVSGEAVQELTHYSRLDFLSNDPDDPHQWKEDLNDNLDCDDHIVE